MSALAMEVKNTVYGRVFVAKPLEDLKAFLNPVSVKDKSRGRSTAVLYAERRLSEWAKWARENRDGLGYPTVSLLYKAMKQRSQPARQSWAVAKLEPDEPPPILTAMGSQTRSLVPPTVGDAPEAIMEVDVVVIRLPHDLHTVIVADYFTYGPIEVRAKQTKWKRARYSQLLECAKYSVFAALDSRTEPGIKDSSEV